MIFLTSLLGALGGGLAAWSLYESGQAQEDQAKQNAKLYRQKADTIMSTMDTETTRMTEASRRLKGEQLAGYSASGAVATEGTPLLVMAEQAGEMQMDILQQRRNRMIEAQQMEYQASYAEYQGELAGDAGVLGALSTLLLTG